MVPFSLHILRNFIPLFLLQSSNHPSYNIRNAKSNTMSRNTIPFSSGMRRERVVVALASPVLAFLCAWCFLMAQSVLSDNRAATSHGRFVLDLFRFLCTDLFAAAFVFLMVAFIWAVFHPGWTVRLLTTLSHHVWRAICLTFLVLLLTALIATLIAKVP